MVPEPTETNEAESIQPFIRWLSLRPIWALGMACLVTIALSYGLTRLGVDFSLTAFVAEDDPLLVEFKRFESDFGNDDTIVVGLHSPSGIFDKETIDSLAAMTLELADIDDVERVTSLANHTQVRSVDDELRVEQLLPTGVEWTAEFLASRRDIALQDEVIPNYLLSKNGQTTLLFVQLRPAFDDPVDLGAAVRAVRAMVKKYESKTAQIYVAGGPAITASFEEEAMKDLTVLLPMMFVLVIVCLAVTLKSVWSIGLALMVVFLSIIATFGTAGWLGVPVTNSSSFLPQILIAIGIADAVHILTVFLRHRSSGHERAVAAAHSLVKNLQPTVLTTVSTSIGFFSFTFSPIESIANFGLLAGVGVFFAWFYSYFFLGAMLFLLPFRAVPKGAATEAEHSGLRPFLSYLVRRRLTVLTVFGALVVVSVWFALQNRVNADPYEAFSEDVPVRIANEFISNEIGGIRGVNLVLRVDAGKSVREPDFLTRVEQLQSWIEARPEVTRTVSLVSILKSMNRSFHNDASQYYKIPETRAAISQFLLLYSMSLPEDMDLTHLMTEEEDALHVSILWTLSDSNRWLAAEEEIKAKAKTLGLVPTITGKGTIFQHLGPYLIETFIESMVIALICISVLLLLVFRSLWMGLLALFTNCIPLFGGAAVFYTTGQAVDFGSVLVASVCLGIAVDDTIHVLSNFQRCQQEGRDAFESVVGVFEQTAPALISTTLILALGFGTLAFGNFVPNIYFGLMTAMILIFALVTDLIFLPAVLVSEPSQES